MLEFRIWFEAQSTAKVVILLGGPGTGKSYVAKMFQSYGFRFASMDQYLEALMRKRSSQDKINVNINEPAQKQDYVWAAIKNDKRMDFYINKGYSFVTEKTGQNYNTVVNLVKLAAHNGYTPVGLWIDSPLDLAISRNQARNRSISQDDLVQTHDKVKKTIMPSSMGGGLKAIFGDNFHYVMNDGTPENNAKINQTVEQIARTP